MSFSINIIGAGTVAKVLGRRWFESGTIELGAVLNRSSSSSEAAVAFMGGGTAVENVLDMPPADLWLLGCNDDAIRSQADALAKCRGLHSGAIVFHLSGALSSRALGDAERKGARVASFHPLQTFADAQRAYEAFAPFCCILEGQPEALEVLSTLVAALDCESYRINANQKGLYHAANAILSNYLVALIDVGLQCYGQAGIDAAQATRMVAPLMRRTLENALRDGPETALTGPISRGDIQLVSEHLRQVPPVHTDLYRSMGLKAVDVARRSGRLDALTVSQLEALLGNEK